jgi:hypothetical protein
MRDNEPQLLEGPRDAWILCDLDSRQPIFRRPAYHPDTDPRTFGDECRAAIEGACERMDRALWSPSVIGTLICAGIFAMAFGTIIILAFFPAVHPR